MSQFSVAGREGGRRRERGREGRRERERERERERGREGGRREGGRDVGDASLFSNSENETTFLEAQKFSGRVSYFEKLPLFSLQQQRDIFILAVFSSVRMRRILLFRER